MLTRETAIKTVLDFVKECKRRNILFTKVILFGSVVHDNMKEDSDIDVALVSESFTYDRFDNALLIAPANIKYDDIEAHTFPTEYFKKGDPFIHEILRTGIEIKIN